MHVYCVGVGPEPAVKSIITRGRSPIEAVFFVVNRAEEIRRGRGRPGGTVYLCHPQAGNLIGHEPVDVGPGVLGVDCFGVEFDIIVCIKVSVILTIDIHGNLNTAVVEAQVSGIDSCIHTGCGQLVVGYPVDPLLGRGDLVKLITRRGPIGIGCRKAEGGSYKLLHL